MPPIQIWKLHFTKVYRKNQHKLNNNHRNEVDAMVPLQHVHPTERPKIYFAQETATNQWVRASESKRKEEWIWYQPNAFRWYSYFHYKCHLMSRRVDKSSNRPTFDVFLDPYTIFLMSFNVNLMNFWCADLISTLRKDVRN